MERTREKEEKKREREKERERGKKSDKQGENGEGGGGRGRQQFAAAEKVMEFRELVVCGWRQWRRERRGRKEGRKEAGARKEARHTCGGEEPRCLEEVDPVFRLITSLLSSRPLSSFRANNKGPRL